MNGCIVINSFFHFNLLSCLWILSALAILAFHVLISCEFSVAVKLKGLYHYGKLKMTSCGSVKTSPPEFPLPHFLCSIPKRWFTHFYAVGLCAHSFVFIFVVSGALGLFFETGLNDLIRWISWPCGESGMECSPYPFLFVYFMEWMQISKRLFECVKVSHFSPGTMSFVHYFYGVFFYSSFGIGLLSSVKMNLGDFPGTIPREELPYICAGVCVFFVAWYYQHQSMLTLASLRSGVKEKASTSHYIPRGHLFGFVSCPHYFCEMVIYASFCLVFQGRNSFLLAVTLFVWVTQIVSGLLTHRWYLQTFPSYPRERRAVIPYLL
ncbi:polyprenol reductase [Aplysia californica]|uniref:Polyprenal reductase n=1 Tax=Aplysia californica TaxID=6500 RepID=A0ABM0K9I5_APLCA|nr:polyprenol reductase [Aplysia californica]